MIRAITVIAAIMSQNLIRVLWVFKGDLPMFHEESWHEEKHEIVLLAILLT